MELTNRTAGPTCDPAHRRVVVDVPVVRLVCPDRHHHLPEPRVLGQAPVVDGNGGRGHVLDAARVNLLQELRVRVDGLLLQVAHHAVSHARADDVGGGVGSEEHGLRTTRGMKKMVTAEVSKESSTITHKEQILADRAATFRWMPSGQERQLT